MSGVARLGRCILAAMLAISAQAAVRLEVHGTAVAARVQASKRGPWSPVGGDSARDLNPGGDLQGDGFPAIQSGASGAAVLVAWARAATGTIELARGTATGWHALPSLQAPGAASSPILAAVDGGWLVLWTDDHGLATATLLNVAGTSSSQTALGQSYVIDAVPADGGAHVVLYSPNPVPVDIFGLRILTLRTMGATLSDVGEVTLDSSVPAATASRIAVQPACEPGTSLVTWQSSGGRMRWARLAADGAVGDPASLDVGPAGVDSAIRKLQRAACDH